jgi:hypothetical protein
MSRTWRRAAMSMKCGRCGAAIVQAEPVLMITIDRVARSVVRCVACEGPAPELPPLVDRTPPAVAFPLTRFTPDMLPLDWKVRQMAREPGEEG